MVIAHHVVAYTWRCYDQSETLKVKALDVSFFDDRKKVAKSLYPHSVEIDEPVIEQ